MPVYEYECKGCGHEFEREQRITDKPVKKCPECGAMKAKRLISRTSFVLKGGGWYNDLYASPKPSGAKQEAKPEGASAEKSDAGDAKGGSKKKDGGKSGGSSKPGKASKAAT